jgi:MFS family permease
MTNEAIADELASLKIGLAIEPEQGHFKELFDKTNLKRTLIVIAISFFQQATGQAFSSQYGAIFVKSLGTVNPYNFAIITSCITTAACLISNLLSDKIGRRKLFIAGAGIQAVALFTMGGLGVASPVTLSESTAIAAMMAIFGAGFGLGWGPLTYVVITELPALSLRDHSQRVSSLTNIGINFAVTFSIPYLLDDSYAGLHSKVGFIFGSIAVCACVFTYLCVPDCQGKSLEEVDRLFHEGVPVRKFKDYQLAALDGAEEDEKVKENRSQSQDV